MSDSALTIPLEDFPATRLIGIEWEGSFAEAATGVIGELMTLLRSRAALADEEHIFGVSWLDRRDGFRHFCGVRRVWSGDAPSDLRVLEAPALRCLTTSHPCGDATTAYARLMEERDRRGLSESRSVSMIDQHLGRGGRMRLWLPISED